MMMKSTSSSVRFALASPVLSTDQRQEPFDGLSGKGIAAFLTGRSKRGVRHIVSSIQCRPQRASSAFGCANFGPLTRPPSGLAGPGSR